MRKSNKLIKYLVIIGIGALIPSIGAANHYKQTDGYKDLLKLSKDLDGRSFKTDPGFPPYCSDFAKVSVAQVKQRISQKCELAIPLSNSSIQNRWTDNEWGHRGWCLSVTSLASRQEVEKRENDLKNCMSNHPTNMKKDCVAGDEIHKQAAAGNIKYVTDCLDAGVKVDVLEANQWTPLHSAARSGRMAMVKLLLSRGAEINAVDIHGRTPLGQAVAGNYPSVEKYLKSQGGTIKPANKNAKIIKDCTTGGKIHKQAAAGTIKYVTACLDAGVKVDVLGANQWTPLHSAARSGRMAMVKLLLSKGAEINAVDIHGRTPLAQAAAGNYPSVEKYLKSQGGTIKPANKNAKIIKDCTTGDKIHKQAATGNIKYVTACLDAGVEVDVQRGINGSTLLHSAVKQGRMAMVELLLSKGAAINAVDLNGKTPLAQAKIHNYPSIQKYLKGKGGR